MFKSIQGFRISCIPQCGELLFFLSEGKIILDTIRVVLNVGSPASIVCLKNETNHKRWFNNKQQEIYSTPGKRITAKANGELIIENVQLSDGGTYECRGLEYTRYYTIYVNGKPNDYVYQTIKFYTIYTCV